MTVRAEVGPAAWVGYSAHWLEEIPRAVSASADYLTFSPVFGAWSKQHPLAAVGVDGLAAACAASS